MLRVYERWLRKTRLFLLLRYLKISAINVAKTWEDTKDKISSISKVPKFIVALFD
jgi:hypothetical protein